MGRGSRFRTRGISLNLETGALRLKRERKGNKMKNHITLAHPILPAVEVLCIAATVVLLIAAGAPAPAEQAPTSRASAVIAPSPALLVAGGAGASEAEGPGNPENRGYPAIAPPFVPTTPYGLTYSQWAAKYWQWTLAFPATADPASDTAPPDSRQSGPVWFLAGAHGSALVNGKATVTRQITVPEATALFFAVLSIFEDNTGRPTYDNPVLTVPQLADQVQNEWNSVASGTFCTIDGVPVNGLANPINSTYLIQSPPFSYTLAPSHNLLASAFGESSVPNGTTVGPAIAEGVFLMVSPLAAGGIHTIRFGGVAAAPASHRPFLAWDITYYITVATPTSGRNPDTILK